MSECGLAGIWPKRAERSTQMNEPNPTVGDLLAAMEALLAACDEAYLATGFVKVSKTSEQRLLIEAAIAAARAEVEEDAEPVDETWLRAIGFTGGNDSRGLYID